MRGGRGLSAGLLALSCAGCSKVAISDVAAEFTLADAAWFAEEETLFLFYRITAEQGLGDPSVVEVTYATDDERVSWTPLTDLDAVHTHVPVNCGTKSLCGSMTIPVPLEPREVDLRLRYHGEGELALNTETVFNVVDEGPAHSHRSLVVYGVFDETNQRVQWRSRHQFPTLRNHDAQDLGLRREFNVREQRYGTDDELGADDNPYSYGETCPDFFEVADQPVVSTEERAIFNTVDLPLDASSESMVCGVSTVTDAVGTFTTDAFGRKNPEVRAAFPVLRSPIRDAVRLEFFLAPCDRTISEDHEEMQRQRLLVGDLEPICIDDWNSDHFVDDLVVTFTEAVEAQRDAGEDMILVIGLHREGDGPALALQDALNSVVPEERHRSSPRLVGAFVFDSDIEGLSVPELEPVILWCPAADGSGASARTCAIAPDNPGLDLGPFSFSTLPILPSRDLYLDFIEDYSKRQAGEVHELAFKTPEFAATTDHLDLGEFGTITFLNGETIDAGPEDAFSYCVQEEEAFVVFRSDILVSDQFAMVLGQWCANGSVPDDFCSLASLGVLTLDWLPMWHGFFGETTYELGLFWDFPFLMHVEYEAFLAGAVSGFGFSVPFGLATDGEAYYGTYMWTVDEFSLEEQLTHCTRFCDNPTFDSAGVYHILDPFRSTYADTCYDPDYPKPSDNGFPLDP